MKKTMIAIAILLIIFLFLILTVNFFVVLSTKNKIISREETIKISEVDCIVILGAGIWGDKPSPMLEDRLLEGFALYQKGVSKKIIVSGDHGREDYDEVNLMKQYLIDKGIPSEDIFMDHAGFSSYDSMYRVKEIFKAKKVIVVTQRYHLYRAIHIAKSLGIEAYGVASNPRNYTKQLYREIREILARDKDFVKCIFKPEPTFLGDAIPISSDGNITNDKNEI